MSAQKSMSSVPGGSAAAQDVYKITLDKSVNQHPEYVLGTFFCHADRIQGMPLAQGRALLRRLTEWAAQPDFFYSHEWQPGDFVIWDNCGVMHRVNPYEDERRTMHRTTLAGTEMVAAGGIPSHVHPRGQAF